MPGQIAVDILHGHFHARVFLGAGQMEPAFGACGNQSLRPRLDRLVEPLQLHSLGAGGALDPGRGSAAHGIGPCAVHFPEAALGRKIDESPGSLEDTPLPSQPAGIVIGQDLLGWRAELKTGGGDLAVQEFGKVPYLEGELSEVAGVLLFESEIALGAAEEDGVRPGGADGLEVLFRKLPEEILIPGPEGVVTAAALRVADHRLDPQAIEELEGTPGRVQSVQVQIAEEDFEVGLASHKIKKIALIAKGARLFGPGSAILLQSGSLQTGECLQGPVVALSGRIAPGSGLPAVAADELRKVDAHWAALATACAGQAGPDFTGLTQWGFMVEAAPNHPSGREVLPFVADRAAPGAHPALHTVVDLLLCELHSAVFFRRTFAPQRDVYRNLLKRLKNIKWFTHVILYPGQTILVKV